MARNPAAPDRFPIGVYPHVRVPRHTEHEMQVGDRGERKVLGFGGVVEALYEQ
jgi:hypothetical protein